MFLIIAVCLILPDFAMTLRIVDFFFMDEHNMLD